MYKRLLIAVLLAVLTAGQTWADNYKWVDYRAENFAGGDGSSGNPYRIETAAQLARVAYLTYYENSNYKDKYYSIEADISLDKDDEGHEMDWKPIGDTYYFTGTVRGNGHVISGMNIANNNYCAGLFGAVVSSNISGIVLKDASITAGSVFGVGLLIGNANKSTITDCHATGNISFTLGHYYVGGLIGAAVNSDVLCCSVSGTMNVNSEDNDIIAGGLIGGVTSDTDKTIENCCTAMTVVSTGTVGGLVGELTPSSNSTITNCFSCSYIDAKNATNAGGLFGHLKISSGDYSGIAINAQFAGTMEKPTASDYYGTIFGKYESNVDISLINDLSCTYDRWLCNMQTNGMGYDLGSKATAVITPLPNSGGRYAIPNAAMNDASVSYKDIFLLCSLPTYITNDASTYYPLVDLTTDFTLGYTDAASAQKVEYLFPTIIEAEVKNNTVRLYDPGEAVMTIRCKGLERKAYFNIAYGTEWDGTTATAFDGGNGTRLSPYVIRTVGQLRLAIDNTTDYNKENMYFRLANDLFMNKHLLQTNEEPRSDARTWTSRNFAANLDGGGHTIDGLYVVDEDCAKETGHGLFGFLSGQVSRLAVVDSYVYASGNAMDVCAGIICGMLTGDGTLEQCMTHGRVLCDRLAGGMVGMVDNNNNFTDCFTCVHVGWATDNKKYEGAGLVSGAYTGGRSNVTRCISTGKVEYAIYNSFGLVERYMTISNSCFDITMMASNFTAMSDGDVDATPAQMISGAMLADAVNWKTEAHRYPMLKLFADTPYGDLLSMPVLFADGDRAGHISDIFEFPNVGVTWSARNGNIDVVSECGAAEPKETTYLTTEYLIAQTEEPKSQSTKALRVMAIDVKDIDDFNPKGITFEDDNARTACRLAFDKNGDWAVNLREAVEATPEQFATFKENAADVQTFRELRYFAGLTILNEGIVSGLENLTAVELPKKMTTIGDNAFSGCTALESVTLPATATTASGLSFYGSGIKNIYVEPKNTSLVSHNGLLFNTNDQLMAYPPGRGEVSATVSGPLDAILPNAFYQIPGLTSIYIDSPLPEGVVADLEDDGIVPASGDIEIYINDGSYNGALYDNYLDDASWQDYDDNIHRYFPLTVTSAGWATLYIGFATQLPPELKAYIVTESSVSTNEATLKRVDNLLPATTPVVIKAEQPGTYLLMPYDGTVAPLDKWENKLIGTYIGQENKWGVPVNQGDANEGSILTLGRNGDGEVGFFYYQGTQIPPYRAYLTYNSIQDSRACFMLRIDDNEESGIEEIDNQQIVNSKSENRKYYDLQGRPVSGKPTHGIYINGNRKVFINKQ